MHSIRQLARSIVAAAACCAVLTGCHYSIRSAMTVRGNGILAKETREVPDFHGIVVANSMTADISIGDSTLLEIETDENILPLISTEVVDGILTIESRDAYSSQHGVRLVIKTPQLDSVATKNASTAMLSGESEKLKLTATNASKIDASGFTTLETEVRAGNASTIGVRATKLLTGSAKNASSVVYYGPCEKIDIEKANASTVRSGD